MMKSIRNIKKGLFVIAMLFAMAPAYSQQANVQLIHNAGDPLLDSIDVWVITFGSPTKFYSNLRFREQSAFLSLPTGFSATVCLAPAGSTSISDTIYSKTLVLNTPTNYLYMFSGLVKPSTFASNPSGRKTNVNYITKNEVRSSAQKAGKFDITFINDVTDAVPLKVSVRGPQGLSVLGNSIAYGDTTSYMSLSNTGDYYLDIVNASTGKKIGSYELDLKNSQYANVTSGIIFTSGFMDSTKNKNGKSFGLFVAIPTLPNGGQTGKSIKLPLVQNAKVQFINASSDPVLKKADIYVFGNKVVNGLSSLAALPFATAASDTTMKVVVAAGGSSSIADSVFTQMVRFNAGDIKVAVLAGSASTTGFAANPQGRSIKAAVYFSDARMASYTKGKFETKVFHGVSDAGYYDVIVNNGPKLMNNGAYTDFGSYTTTASGPLSIEVKDSAATTVLRRFKMDFTGLADSAGILLLTGYDVPANNKSGAAIGMVAVLPHGQVISATETTGILANKATGNIDMNIYPNPAQSNAIISYQLAERANVRISVLDETGRLVSATNMGEQAGAQQYMLNINKLSAGVYYVQLQAGSSIGYQKLMVY